MLFGVGHCISADLALTVNAVKLAVGLVLSLFFNYFAALFALFPVTVGVRLQFGVVSLAGELDLAVFGVGVDIEISAAGKGFAICADDIVLGKA